MECGETVREKCGVFDFRIGSDMRLIEIVVVPNQILLKFNQVYGDLIIIKHLHRASLSLSVDVDVVTTKSGEIVRSFQRVPPIFHLHCAPVLCDESI